jgi:hypothetical protein
MALVAYGDAFCTQCRLAAVTPALLDSDMKHDGFGVM